jgi:universal stress protein A
MYKHILVALSQDPDDEAVVLHASALAGLTQAEVLLLHVVHSHSLDEAAFRRERAEDYLERRAASFSDLGVKVETKVVTSEPSAAIAAIARESQADLIVMATHGHSGVRHLFVGSVTEEVIRQVAIPVLLITPKE